MQLLIDHLPQRTREEADTGHVIDIFVYRHWLVYPDGRVFYQNECIEHYASTGEFISSVREDWIQLPTPPQQEAVAGTFEYAGLPGVVTVSGKAYLWAAKSPETEGDENMIRVLSQERRIHEWPHTWVPFAEPVPGTPSFAEYDREDAG